MSEQIPQWLAWAREIQALAQTGAHYALNDFQTERYHRLAEIAAEIVSAHTGLPAPELAAGFKAQPGYATPKVDVRAAVFNDAGEILMVQESRDGGWTLPGGWADIDDAPAAGAEREAWEESGFTVQARKLVGVYDANRIDRQMFDHAYKLVFLCDLVSGEAKTSNETSAVAFFSRAAIPQPFSGERTNMRHIEAAFAAWEDDAIPTVFD